MAKQIYLVRHGQPDTAFAGRYLGRLNPSLSPEGIRQAERLAVLLSSLSPNLSPRRCLASPLRRARETAAILAAACRLEVEEREELLEIDFGLLEGKTFAEARAMHPAAGNDSWQTLAGRFAFPGGEDFAAFDRRAASMAQWAVETPEESVLLVAHGGILRGILCRLLQLPADGPLRFRFDHAGLAVLETSSDPDNPATLVGFNCLTPN